MSYIRYYITDGLGDSDSNTQTDPALDRSEPEPIREPPDSLPTPPTFLNDVEDKVTEYYVILMNALVNQLHVFYREDDRIIPNK